jgi:hypothetical protein
MKNKIMAMLVAFGMVGSVSAVEINENLSINGFIDGSITKVDNQVAPGATSTDEADWGLDEVEVNFLFNVGSVSGMVALDSQNIGTGNDDIEIEQAHFTYTLDNGVSLTFGRYGSALGLEREDPAGLYTYSRAYGSTAFNLGDIDSSASEGLNISYAADAWNLGVSIDNPAGDIRNGATATKNDLDFEVSLSYTGIENLNVGIGYRKNNESNSSHETDVFNVHATYQVGKALLGVEYTELQHSSTVLSSAHNASGFDTARGDRDALTLLVDYDVSDKLGVAVRYSTYESLGATAGVDVDQITIAPNYAITESLGAILEYSDVSSDATNSDSDTIALELTYTF